MGRQKAINYTRAWLLGFGD